MKDAYYFSHDSNARNDTKILAMRSDYGIAGYGMYWIIIETLRDESDYKLHLKPYTIKALAMQMSLDTETVNKFIDDCINLYELFEIEGDYFWSESLCRRMEKVQDIKDKRKQAVSKRWDKQNNEDEIQENYKSNTSVLQNDTKERKGKEKKGKESKINNNKEEYVENAQKVLDFYHKYLPMLPSVKKLTPQRITYINKRVEDSSLEEVEAMLIEASKSDFLTGKSKDWKATLDWLMNPNNFIKVLEGNYANKEGTHGKFGKHDLKNNESDWPDLSHIYFDPNRV